MSDFFHSLVKAIQDGVKPETVTINNKQYCSHLLHHPPRDPQPDPIEVISLTGLVGLVKRDFLAEDVLIHVESNSTVYVLGNLEGRHLQRATYAVASIKDTIGAGFPFGQYLDQEKFIVNLQSQFVKTEQRDLLLQIVGNIKSGNVRTLADDGVSQEVTSSVGVTRVSDVKLPNPIQLQPYRTFTEVDQPESEFILRMKGGNDLPTIALFAADGNNWKLAAMQAIQSYLADRLPGFTVLA